MQYEALPTPPIVSPQPTSGRHCKMAPGSGLGTRLNPSLIYDTNFCACNYKMHERNLHIGYMHMVTVLASYVATPRRDALVCC